MNEGDSMQNDPIVIVGLARTPMGAFQGGLKGFAAPELGAAAIRAAVERSGIRPNEVQEVLMGCVLPAGQGQAPARQAPLGAVLPAAGRGPGPPAPGLARCRAAARGWLHYGEQDVRFWNEGGDVRARLARREF